MYKCLAIYHLSSHIKLTDIFKKLYSCLFYIYSYSTATLRKIMVQFISITNAFGLIYLISLVVGNSDTILDTTIYPLLIIA